MDENILLTNYEVLIEEPTVSHSEIALVLSGNEILKGSGFLKNVVYITKKQLESIRTIKSNEITNMYGLGNCYTEKKRFYSSYEDHGLPSFRYCEAIGLDIKSMFDHLGINTNKSSVLSVTSEDLTSKNLEDIFGFYKQRYSFDPDGKIFNEVLPILILFEKRLDVSKTCNNQIYDHEDLAGYKETDLLFCFGQTSADDPNRCSWVKHTRRLRIGIEDLALEVNIGRNKTITSSLSNIISKDLYKIKISACKNKTKINYCLFGTPLNILLKKLGVKICENQKITATDNQFNKTQILFKNLENYFIIWDGFLKGHKIQNATALQLYYLKKGSKVKFIKNLSSFSVEEVSLEPFKNSKHNSCRLDYKSKQIHNHEKYQGGNFENSIFYIAIEDEPSKPIKYYYYTFEELKAYEQTKTFTYNDHSIIKSVTTKGVCLYSLLCDIKDSKIDGDMVIQYAESDGYHSDKGISAENSSYKDKVKWLINSRIDSSGDTIEAVNTIISYGINTNFKNPDENNLNDPDGVFNPIDDCYGKLRAYRKKRDANAAVIKHLLGAAVSWDGNLLSGDCGCVIRITSSKNIQVPIRPALKVSGFVQGMKYLIKAPSINNAILSHGQKKQKVISHASNFKGNELEFIYDEKIYFSINTEKQKINYVYTDFLSNPYYTQVPTLEEGEQELKSTGGKVYGYFDSTLYRYNGIWLKDLIKNVDNQITFICSDDKSIFISKMNISKYFVACGHTESKSITNVSENKRISVVYPTPCIITPSKGFVVSTDYQGCLLKEKISKENLLILDVSSITVNS